MSVSFMDTDSYIQLPKVDFQSKTNITIVMKTEADKGLLFYTGRNQHLTVELFRGRVAVSFYVGSSPLSNMFSYLFSFVKVDDNRLHVIEMLLDRKNFTLRVDGGNSRMVSNQGEGNYLNVEDDVYLGGIPHSKGEEARRKYHLRHKSGFRGNLFRNVFMMIFRI